MEAMHFQALLNSTSAALLAQHERDIDGVVQSLLEENRLLKKEVQELTQEGSRRSKDIQHVSLKTPVPMTPKAQLEQLRAAGSVQESSTHLSDEPPVPPPEDDLESMVTEQLVTAPETSLPARRNKRCATEPAPPSSLDHAKPDKNRVRQSTSMPDAEPASKKGSALVSGQAKATKVMKVDSGQSCSQADSSPHSQPSSVWKFVDESSDKRDRDFRARQRARLNRTLGMPFTTAAAELTAESLRELRANRTSLMTEVECDQEQEQEQVPPEVQRRRSVSNGLGSFVGFAVLLSVLALGISMDLAPHSDGWVMLEAGCLFVFVAEFVIKISYLEKNAYFCGENMVWNWIDFTITSLSLIDFVLTLMGLARVGKFANALRGLRLLRMVRIIKILQTPLVKDLASMLYGVILGAPALFWVLVLLVTVVYVMGLAFRISVAPEPGSDSIIEQCGFSGDNVPPDASGDCNKHYLYGEEFFGTMPKAMFTVFRCMTWDCSTGAGQSLTVYFSRGYGMMFDVFYYFGTVILVFGVFNVITAIFVETTMHGLKRHDSQRKLAPILESQYVQGKLKLLVKRIVRSKMEDEDDDWKESGEITLTEGQFYHVLQDKRTAAIFDDLDVSVQNPPRLFDIFDTDGDGEVGLVEIIDMLMMLRGELQKTDMVASLITLHGLGDKIDELQSFLLECNCEKAVQDACRWTVNVGMTCSGGYKEGQSSVPPQRALGQPAPAQDLPVAHTFTPLPGEVEVWQAY